MPMSNGVHSSLIGVVEAGTRTCRFVAYGSKTLQEVEQHEIDVTIMRPQEGWVEQDPVEILEATNACIEQVVQRIPNGHIATLGITNQRETTVVWDRLTGRPLYNALVWNDIRTSSTVDRLLARFPDRNQDYLRPRCGLPVSPYFSGVKLRWLLDNVPAVCVALAEGRCLFGTVDTWLIWNLTGGVSGGLHITDVTNASRTLLMNIDTLKWDHDLCAALDIPMSILPEIRSCSEIVGRVKSGPLSGTIISGIMGNQQAALVGERCLREGQAKNTYRSGCFLLYNTGKKRVHSTHGLLSTVAYRMGPDAPTVYALEGSVAVAGHALNWLKQNMLLLDNPADSEKVGAEVSSTGDVYFVPAFTGLYAPHWRKDARGILCGLTQFTTKAHIVRAALEAVCYQTRDILESMAKDCNNVPLTELRVDGKMAANNLLLQLQADLCGVPVVRSDINDKAALGVALAAGQASGVELVSLYQQPIPAPLVDEFQPLPDEGERRARYQKWKMAVSRSLGWATTTKSAAMTDSRYHMLASIPAGIYLITSFSLLAFSEFSARRLSP